MKKLKALNIYAGIGGNRKKWKDFKPMIKVRGAMSVTTEAIWSNLPTAFDHEQLDLFN